jgi:integrase
LTLDNGIPIDTVSKMLGHRSIKTTQIYAKVSNKKISDDTKELFQRLSDPKKIHDYVRCKAEFSILLVLIIRL